MKNIKNYISKNKWYFIVGAAIILIKTFLYMFLTMSSQYAGGDELATMASAVKLAGYDWTPIVADNNSYYGFGYSILMTPIFRLTKNVHILYPLLLSYHTICATLSGIICMFIMKKYLEVESDLFCTIISVASACFFASANMSTTIINEPMLTLIVWINVLLLLKLSKENTKKQKYVYTGLLCLLLTYSLTVHSRSIIIIAVNIAVIICLLIQNKKWIVSPSVFIMFTTIGYFISKYLTKYVQVIVWGTKNGEQLNNSSEVVFSMKRHFYNLLGLQGIKSFVYSLVGQLYSLFVLSGGLFAIVFVVGIYFTFKVVMSFFSNKYQFYETEKKLEIPFLFAILGIAVTWILICVVGTRTTVPALKQGKGTKWFLYLRYMAIFCPVAVMSISVWLKNNYVIKKKLLITSGILFCVVTVFSHLLILPKLYGESYKSTDVYSYFSAFSLQGINDVLSAKTFYFATIAGLLIFIFLLFTIKKKEYNKMAILICMLFIYIAGYKTLVISKGFSDEMYSDVNRIYCKFLEVEEQNELPKDIYLYTSGKNKQKTFRNALQFVLSRHTIQLEIPKNEEECIIVSNIEKDMGKEFHTFNLGNNQYLYIKGERLVQLFEEK